MSSGSRVALLAVLVASCGHVTRDGEADPEGEFGIGPDFVEGQRLKIPHYSTDDSFEWSLYGIYDSARDEECAVVRTADGKQRCMPRAALDANFYDHYVDPACSEPILEWYYDAPPSALPLAGGSRRMRSNVLVLRDWSRVHRRRSLRARRRRLLAVIALLSQLPLSLGAAARSGSVRRRRRAGDGIPRRADGFRRSARATLGAEADGVFSCIPELATGRFPDPECTRPIAMIRHNAGPCGPPPSYVLMGATLHHLGAKLPVPSEAFLDNAGVCEELSSSTFGYYDFYAVGAEVEAGLASAAHSAY